MLLLFPTEQGQGLVEYAFILTLVVVVVVATLVLLGPTVSNLYNTVMNTPPF